MKKEKRNNKIYFILFIVCLFIMILCTLYELNLFDLIRQYYSNNIKTSSLMFYLKEKIFETAYGFDYIIIWGTNIFQCIIPFFGIIAIYVFQETSKNFTMALKISLSIFSAYVIYYLLIIYLFKGLNSDYISGELFLDIFGRNFYYKHIYFYYLLDGLVRFFFIPFVYSVFGIILNKIISKKIICSYLLILYYYGFSLLALILKEFVGKISIYFNPSTIAYSNIYENINTFLILFANLFPILLALFLYYFKNKKGYEITNCFKNKFIYILVNALILGLSSILLAHINKNAESTIVTLYNNIGFFLIYLYFSHSLCFDIYNNSKTIPCLKKIIIINFILCLFLFIMYYTIMKFTYLSFDMSILIYLNCNLFLILMVIYLFQYSINYKNINIKNYWLLICLFSFIYMIKYMYMENFLFINLFDYYLINNTTFNFNVIHYIIWILIPLIIILFKKKIVKKDN